MSKRSQGNFTFEGFEQANTTPVPDVFFDKLLPELSGSELKVLLYIIRRTKGFKKDSDAISLTQFEHGIVTQEGKVLDRGCGLKDRETICKALKSLEGKGCIKSEKRTTNKGDNDTTVYSIRFKGEVVGKTDQGSRNRREKVVGKTDPQETVLQQTESMNANESSPSDSHSLTHSFSSLSLEEQLAYLEAEAKKLRETISSQQSTKPENPSSETDTNETAPSQEQDPLTLYTPEERQQHEWWCQVALEAKINETNKKHWRTLSKHIHSFEEFKGHFEYVRGLIQNDPNAKDKRVKPGNLANADNLSGWKQKQQEQEQPQESKEEKKMTIADLTKRSFSSLVRL